MTPETRALHEEIAALTLGVARPLIWHDRTETWPKRLDGATCFFLRFESGTIGVTADHVVGAYENAVRENPNIICQLRTSSAFDLLGAIIARDAARDIATFSVPIAVSSEINAIPIDCRGNWPPPEPQHRWKLSLCGFPESIRTTRRDRSAEFQAWGALSTVESVTSNEILITYDPTETEAATWAPNLPPVGFNMSGCSGGPVLVHGIKHGLHRWFPVALIAEGPKEAEKKSGAAAEFDMIRLRRVHAIQPDGTITRRAEDFGGWLPAPPTPE